MPETTGVCIITYAGFFDNEINYMNILFVTKDIGGANMTIPLARVLVHQKHTVKIISEGISSNMWEKHGFIPHLRAKGDGLLQKHDVVAGFDEVSPDIVVATLGSPINAENICSKIANERKMPLVWAPDVWGAEHRSNAIPNLLLAFDGIEAKNVKKRQRFKDTKVTITGHPLLQNARKMQGGRKSLSNKPVILLAGQGIVTDEMIDMLRKCLELSNTSFSVIPKFHPKFNRPEHRSMNNGWEKKLLNFPKDTLLRSDVSMDKIASMADVTWSCYGVALLISAWARKVPMCVRTDSIATQMHKSTRFRRHPLATHGVAVEITKPVSLDPFLLKRKMQYLYKKRSLFIPFNADTAVQTILAQKKRT